MSKSDRRKVRRHLDFKALGLIRCDHSDRCSIFFRFVGDEGHYCSHLTVARKKAGYDSGFIPGLSLPANCTGGIKLFNFIVTKAGLTKHFFTLLTVPWRLSIDR